MSEITPNIISALKRLERAGSEESQTTQKLVEAARQLGEHIAPLCPTDATGLLAGGHDLPRGYSIGTMGMLRDMRRVLQSLDSMGDEVPVDSDRSSALAFAADIATGWLDELASWLEARASESTDATARLERAAEAMR